MKKLSLTSWIFIAMAVGIAVGHFFPEFGKALSPISTVFIRLIKSIIAPLLFATLVVGIASSGSAKAMGRIGLKAMIYFEIVTTAALAVGLIAVNLVKPGVGVTLEKGADAGLPQAHATFMGMLEHTFPSSIIDAMAKGEVLQMVVFCFLFGTACTVIGAKAQPVVTFLQSLADVMFEYTKYVMYVAPLGVGAAMAATVGAKGIGVLEGLGKLVLTLYGALFVFVVGVLGLVVLIFSGSLSTLLVGVPKAAAPLFMVPPVLLLLAAVMVTVTVILWVKGYWSAWRRVYYTLLTLAAITLVVILTQWEMMTVFL